VSSEPASSPSVIEAVIAAVRRVAEQEVMPRYLKVAQRRKTDGSLLTEADVAAQQALAQVLPTIHPGVVIGEEMSQDLQTSRWLDGGDGLWCVDPIDGTSNFVNGLPYFAVSAALLLQGRPVLGVVYNPVAEEVFWARRGHGAYLNGERLPIKSRAPGLATAMAGVDFKRLPERLARSLAYAPPYASQRNYGASTLDWCYTAAGRFDVYVHGGQKPWDYAAGALILEEAGGALCTLVDDDFWAAPLWHRSAVASWDPALLRDWSTWLRAHL
jgi:myo-inositol-1(or 4)-monophosphatase